MKVSWISLSEYSVAAGSSTVSSSFVVRHTSASETARGDKRKLFQRVAPPDSRRAFRASTLEAREFALSMAARVAAGSSGSARKSDVSFVHALSVESRVAARPTLLARG